MNEISAASRKPQTDDDLVSDVLHLPANRPSLAAENPQPLWKVGYMV
jgi:hypothetical protein